MSQHSKYTANKIVRGPHSDSVLVDNFDDDVENAHCNVCVSHPATSDDGSMDPDSGVKRGLQNRHLSMMALAGIIGPGLLVGAGGALNNGGPASLLIGFAVIGGRICSDGHRRPGCGGNGFLFANKFRLEQASSHFQSCSP